MGKYVHNVERLQALVDELPGAGYETGQSGRCIDGCLSTSSREAVHAAAVALREADDACCRSRESAGIWT